MKIPCRECEARSPTCHAECGRYLEYREWIRERAEAEKLSSQALSYEMTRCKRGRVKQALHQKTLGRKYAK